VLLEAIQNFTGTVLFVSHDRYFIDRLATRVFEVEGGHAQVYPGNYEDYLWRKEGGPDAVASALASTILPSPAPVPQPIPETRPEQKNGSNDKGRRVNPIKRKQMEDRVGVIEEELPRLESSIAGAEQALGVFVSVEETQRVSAELDALRAQHSQLTSEWEELMLQLEEQTTA
jgi:ATP-binding cassette, subfamily F, member 3